MTPELDDTSPSAPLFGGSPDNSGTDAGSTSLDNTPANNQPAASAPAPDASTLTVEEWRALPKAWKAELANDWESLPQNVRQYIHKRETDVVSGIRQYAQGHKAWSEAIEPLASVLPQNPNIDPVSLYKTLAANHVALVQAAPEDRRAMFLQMAQHYGVDFAQAAAGQQGQAAASGFSPEQIAQLRQMLQPALAPVQTFLESQQRERIASMNSAVDAFFSDPQNEFVEKVAPQMIEIFKSGQAKDLATAYELACLRDPSVKPAYLNKQLAKAGQAPQPPVHNVKSSVAPPSPGKPKSIDDTFKQVLAKHFPA